MYNGVVTSMKTSGDITNEFPITIGLYQRSTMNPYLFAIIIDELTKSIQEKVP
jgi:hypothetical protein